MLDVEDVTMNKIQKHDKQTEKTTRAVYFFWDGLNAVYWLHLRGFQGN